eukprot:TRINITY_DN34437_c0_g1_i1.p1 TRINITY_DN34437_c0_g1~~TRINITY_DN34437_c0_g1_i1.p1  ORF type:complete len:168 (+),score=11.52 TRINITY_DN34437_c0_g1_i1:483-986(+)
MYYLSPSAPDAENNWLELSLCETLGTEALSRNFLCASAASGQLVILRNDSLWHRTPLLADWNYDEENRKERRFLWMPFTPFDSNGQPVVLERAPEAGWSTLGSLPRDLVVANNRIHGIIEDAIHGRQKCWGDYLHPCTWDGDALENGDGVQMSQLSLIHISEPTRPY